VYTLISAPVLGFDLTRMDGGAATAELLEAMLGVPAGGWAAVAGRVPPESPALAEARETAVRLAELRPSVRDLGDGDTASAVTLLQRAPIGNVAALVACLRNDVLVPDGDGPAPESVAALAEDAVCATYLRELLTDADRRELARGWLAVRRHLPVAPTDLGPQHAAIHRLLGTIRSLPPGGVRALAAAADRIRADGSSGGTAWATAMHSLTWAVHLSGRVRAAATVQLRLVQAVDLAGVPVADRAAGVWNLLSGAAQALVVRDLADGDSAAELLSPAVSALGAGWLATG
jgi:hypothetical protein